MIEKIDINKIRGQWIERDEKNPYFIKSGGDDTIRSIQIVAQQVNEIIDILNNLTKDKE